MPISVALQNIHGKKYKELVPDNVLLDRLLPIGDARFSYLRWIDPYGNTIFNGMQMYPFLDELDRLASEIPGEEERHVLRELRELAIHCRDHPHTYLRFIGD